MSSRKILRISVFWMTVLVVLMSIVNIVQPYSISFRASKEIAESGVKVREGLSMELMNTAAYHTCLTYLINDFRMDNEQCIFYDFKPLSTLLYNDTNSRSNENGLVIARLVQSDMLVFAFRGDTTSKLEKLWNLRQWYNGGLESSEFNANTSIPVLGFAHAKYSGLRCVVQEYIKHYKRSNVKLLFTGHSLGGPSALLAAFDALVMGVPKDRIEVITFNAIRAGGIELNKHLAKTQIRHTRVLQEKDILTAVPLSSKFLYQPSPVIVAKSGKILDPESDAARRVGNGPALTVRGFLEKLATKPGRDSIRLYHSDYRGFPFAFGIFEEIFQVIESNSIVVQSGKEPEESEGWLSGFSGWSYFGF